MRLLLYEFYNLLGGDKESSNRELIDSMRAKVEIAIEAQSRNIKT